MRHLAPSSAFGRSAQRKINCFIWSTVQEMTATFLFLPLQQWGLHRYLLPNFSVQFCHLQASKHKQKCLFSWPGSIRKYPSRHMLIKNYRLIQFLNPPRVRAPWLFIRVWDRSRSPVLIMSFHSFFFFHLHFAPHFSPPLHSQVNGAIDLHPSPNHLGNISLAAAFFLPWFIAKQWNLPVATN